MSRVVLVILSLPIWAATVLIAIYAGAVWLLTGRSWSALMWLVSIDQLGNSLAFGNPDETISSRAGRCAQKGGNRPCYWLCRLLHVLDKNHCEKSIGT